MTTEERANAGKAAHDRGSSITQLLGSSIFVPLQNGRVDIGARTRRNSRYFNSNYQPAGNASALAAGRYAAHREDGARLATLRFVLTGSGVTETSGTGSFSRAKASRGGLVTGASAMTGDFCGTMVGALVSKTIRSGHLRSDFILIICLLAGGAQGWIHRQEPVCDEQHR